jgi:ribosomal protein S18 acetylase RimI-like enzyme
MYWRLEEGERWEDLKGAPAKRRFKGLVTGGEALGVLAYLGNEPVGWCAYGPRTDFVRLGRSRTLACDDADQVWSLPCFFIKAGHRGKGIATALLRHALADIKKRRGRIAEGYPVHPHSPGKKIPAAFAWTGTRSLFRAAGFRVVGNAGGGKERVRKDL